MSMVGYGCPGVSKTTPVETLTCALPLRFAAAGLVDIDVADVPVRGLIIVAAGGLDAVELQLERIKQTLKMRVKANKKFRLVLCIFHLDDLCELIEPPERLADRGSDLPRP